MLLYLDLSLDDNLGLDHRTLAADRWALAGYYCPSYTSVLEAAVLASYGVPSA